MQRNFALIVIFAVLVSTANGFRWRNQHSHNHGCHHSNDWNTEDGSSSSSSSEEHDWPHHGEHDPHKHHSWRWDNNYYHRDHHPNNGWGGNYYNSQGHIFKSSTSSSLPQFPSHKTVFPEQPTPSSSDTRVTPNQPTPSTSETTINLNQPSPSPSDITVYPNQPNPFPSDPTIYPNLQTLLPSDTTVNLNQANSVSGDTSVYPSQTEIFPSGTPVNSNEPTSFPGDTSVSSNQPTLFPGDTSVFPNQPTSVPSETSVFPNLPTSVPGDITILYSSPTSPPLPTSEKSSVDVQTCLLSCPVTEEYQPICGTNYQTYNNMGRFLCAQRCGVDVRIFIRRSCPSLDVGMARFTTVQCIESCPITEEYNPVCGSDDITYDNPSVLLCAQMCGYGVKVKSMTTCSEVTTTPTTLLKSPSLPHGVRLCMEACDSTPEIRPVCGTNDVTYKNPSHLNCARICGIDVELKHRSQCGQINTGNNPSVPSVDSQRVSPLPPAVQLCVGACSITAEFNPVCGTNGITYYNPGQLECDQACGIRVYILQRSPCSTINNNQLTPSIPTPTSTTLSPVVLAACINSCPQTPEYNPVCGTNGVTYNNPGHLSCAQACGINVGVKRRSSCPPTVVTQPPTNKQPTAPITNPPLSITVKPAIDINGDSSNANVDNNAGINVGTSVPTQAPSGNTAQVTTSPALPLNIFTDATTTTTEADEAVDFDTRFGEDKKSRK